MVDRHRNRPGLAIASSSSATCPEEVRSISRTPAAVSWLRNACKLSIAPGSATVHATVPRYRRMDAERIVMALRRQRVEVPSIPVKGGGQIVVAAERHLCAFCSARFSLFVTKDSLPVAIAQAIGTQIFTQYPDHDNEEFQ